MSDKDELDKSIKEIKENKDKYFTTSSDEFSLTDEQKAKIKQAIDKSPAAVKEIPESDFECEWIEQVAGQFVAECIGFHKTASISFISGFKYCPFCGNKIKFIYKWQGKE